MKTGLYGGTFDPLHNGHIKVAQAAKNHLQLDRIIFIPAGDPPHKTEQEITDKAHRLAMVKMAAEAVGASVSDWELSRKERSYSVETVRHFKELYPDDEIFFIIGADSFRDLPSWWHYRELMGMCNFVVVSRPDVEKSTFLSRFDGDEIPPRVFFLDNIFMDISSTGIRQMVKEGEDISRLVPPAVAGYIKTNGLYKG
ncbi:MAG: nicotinate-nucleotide adenylyltransferase [Clostridia bacterium]|nr:nicotinate-nucleotide adenylyltransferase [Clostridia bacterium]